MEDKWSSTAGCGDGSSRDQCPCCRAWPQAQIGAAVSMARLDVETREGMSASSSGAFKIRRTWICWSESKGGHEV